MSTESPAAPSIADATPTALTELTRTYDFGHGAEVTLADVVELIVRPSGSHRVRTADGRLHYVAKGWLAIHIDDGGKGWTV
ncbi:hypothetical protein [Microbacterium sp. 77mftsu3.1]|uniref:hypothetical protein n=1 Tax=Microbacterium sp. 77mftsu3.1 TaxID=1761802 RepID=UPI0003695B51|nr:hypothetical protein [Microbacterium sp. 77mftsu3.1]SDH43655.1 hypothetical protein SAMN04488590_3343 [Microbacterium sp. 77mftsu3.1]